MSEEFRIEQWEQYEGDNWWKWAVWIEGSDPALDHVEWVEWTLHPTFPHPIRKKNDRATKFRLETGGWGTFKIVARVKLKGNTQVKLIHFLRLHYPDNRPATA